MHESVLVVPMQASLPRKANHQNPESSRRKSKVSRYALVSIHPGEVRTIVILCGLLIVVVVDVDIVEKKKKQGICNTCGFGKRAK